jgi:hypothetical protein
MLGLQAHEVSRLSRTWARVGSQGMKIMQDLVEFTTMLRNWKNLRDAMQDIIDEWGDSSGAAAAAAAASASATSSHGMGRGESPSLAMAAIPTPTSPGSSHRQGQLGLFSKKSSTIKDKSLKGGMALHSKSVSGPVFPSLISSLSNKDKDRERQQQQYMMQMHWHQQQQQGGLHPQQLHHQPSLPHPLNTEREEKDKEGRKIVQQQHKGCIPVLGKFCKNYLFSEKIPSCFL